MLPFAYYRAETAATTAISPDGRWVVFVRNTIIEAENQRHGELWIAPADGSAPAVRLTSPAFSASVPRWRTEVVSRVGDWAIDQCEVTAVR